MISAFDQGIKYLSTREHSTLELRTKLVKKGYDLDDINRVLVQLKSQNLQSDKRFTKDFITARVNQGKGLVLINYELRQRGIEKPDLDGVDFFQLAKQVRIKKFGDTPPKNLKDKSKQMRFLQARGFDFDQIKQSFEPKL